MDEAVNLKSFAAFALGASLLTGVPIKAQEPVHIAAATQQTAVHRDSTIHDVLKLLAGIGVHPKSIVVTGVRPPGSGRHMEAYTFKGNPNVYVMNDSNVYKRAAAGDRIAMKELAAQIAHEDHHIRFPDARHGDAYQAQIDALKKLGAPTNIIFQIQGIQSKLDKGYKGT